VLLQAIKEGHWFLVDEMNLAQQSVLEGLNAILDHRRTVYIPELNQEYQCHPDFFVFACQNPSQSSSSVGGRKSLPKSFLNRFNKIYLEELIHEDYLCILERQVGQDPVLEHLDVPQLLQMTLDLQAFIQKAKGSCLAESESSINLRDLSRFLKIYKHLIGETGGARDLCMAQCIDICYFQPLTKEEKSKAIENVVSKSGLVHDSQLLKNLIIQYPNVRVQPSNEIVFDCLKPTVIQNSRKQPFVDQLELRDMLALQGPQSKGLHFLVDCLHTNLPLLVVSDNCQATI